MNLWKLALLSSSACLFLLPPLHASNPARENWKWVWLVQPSASAELVDAPALTVPNKYTPVNLAIVARPGTAKGDNGVTGKKHRTYRTAVYLNPDNSSFTLHWKVVGVPAEPSSGTEQGSFDGSPAMISFIPKGAGTAKVEWVLESNMSAEGGENGRPGWNGRSSSASTPIACGKVHSLKLDASSWIAGVPRKILATATTIPAGLPIRWAFEQDPVASLHSSGAEPDLTWAEFKTGKKPGNGRVCAFIDLEGAEPVSAELKLTEHLPIAVSAGPKSNSKDASEGLCVLQGAAVYLTLAQTPTGREAAHWVRWEIRKMQRWGSMGEWFPAETTDHARGAKTAFGSGIYQVRAVSWDGEESYAMPMRRPFNPGATRNSEGVANPVYEMGQLDYVGVVSDRVKLDLVSCARSWLGSTKYARSAYVDTMPGRNYLLQPSTRGVPKCNIFVTHRANEARAYTPYWARKSFQLTLYYAPIARDDWYQEPEVHVDLDEPGWVHLQGDAELEPGMAIASAGGPTNEGISHGHVGILDYDGGWIQAGDNTVNKYPHMSNLEFKYTDNSLRSR